MSLADGHTAYALRLIVATTQAEPQSVQAETFRFTCRRYEAEARKN